MPANNFVTKPIPAQPYRVDGRATVGQPIRPLHTNIADGPTLSPVSGVRVHYPSGTDN